MSVTQKAQKKILAIVGSHEKNGYDVAITKVKAKKMDPDTALPKDQYAKAKYTDLTEKRMEELKELYDVLRRQGIFFPAKFTKTTAEFDLSDRFEAFQDPLIQSFSSVNSQDVYATVKVTADAGKGKVKKTVRVPKRVRVVGVICKFKDGFVVVLDKSGTPINHLCGYDSKELQKSISEYRVGNVIENEMAY